MSFNNLLKLMCSENPSIDKLKESIEDIPIKEILKEEEEKNE